MRPDWDTYFTGVAQAVAARSSCPRASVGAVLVGPDRRILATGYNGAPAGQPDCEDAGCAISNDHCQRAIHAEVNAVGYAARWGVSLQGARLYLYLYDRRGEPREVKNALPCRECNKVLTAAGVKGVEYVRADHSGGGAAGGVRAAASSLRPSDRELRTDSPPVDGVPGRPCACGSDQCRCGADDGAAEDGAADGVARPQGLRNGLSGLRSDLREGDENRPVDPRTAICRRCTRPMMEHPPLGSSIDQFACEEFLP